MKRIFLIAAVVAAVATPSAFAQFRVGEIIVGAASNPDGFKLFVKQRATTKGIGIAEASGTEQLRLFHNGTAAVVESSADPLEFWIGGTAKLSISAAGNTFTGDQDINGTLTTAGLITALATKTAAYTATATDCTILGDATSAAFSVTLPAAASHTGRIYVIKKIDASANAVTIDGNAAETIDGAATVALAAQWNVKTIQSNGTAWFVIAN